MLIKFCWGFEKSLHYLCLCHYMEYNNAQYFISKYTYNKENNNKSIKN